MQGKPLLNKLIVGVLGAIGTYVLVGIFSRRRKIFISFAVEDRSLRDLFAGQSENSATPFEFADMSVKEPWSSSWKSQCRERIKSCDGVIVLLSENTINASGVHWEVKCALEEQIPVLVIHSGKKIGKKRLPLILRDCVLHPWSWSVIEEFVAEV